MSDCELYNQVRRRDGNGGQSNTGQRGAGQSDSLLLATPVSDHGSLLRTAWPWQESSQLKRKLLTLKQIKPG